MGRRSRSAAAFGRAVEVGARCTALLLATVACTTTLDPSVDVGAGSGTGSLTSCELFTSEASEYMICPERTAFDAAAADCARRDATLVTVGSAAENDFIAASAGTVVIGDLWLGGTRNDAFVWSWPDGSVFWRGGPDGMAEAGVFADWKPGEPNNASTTSPDPERCLAMTPANDWNDRACALSLPYICERLP